MSIIVQASDRCRTKSRPRNNFGKFGNWQRSSWQDPGVHMIMAVSDRHQTAACQCKAKGLAWNAHMVVGISCGESKLTYCSHTAAEM